MKKLILLALLIIAAPAATAAPESNPVSELAERIHKGTSKKFIFELADQQSEEDFFELENQGGKIAIRGNNYVSIAAGLNWYLKYYAGAHVTWNDPHPNLNMRMPPVRQPERHSTDIVRRWYLSYPAFSYSTAFWDWERWQQEIDWMALHGINLPLSLTGTATVWRNMLLRLGYSREDINKFIAGPAHQAWWMRGQIEGIGSPAMDTWCHGQQELQQKILDCYRKWGMEPVLAGFSGMMPSGSSEKSGINVNDGGWWQGFKRASYIDPADPKFAEIAAIYYEESEKLFGKANFYSADPFYTGKSPAEDARAGRAVLAAIKEHNPLATWVVMGEGDYPSYPMIDDLPQGDLLIIDTRSQSRPGWGDPRGNGRGGGYNYHDWIYCMAGNAAGTTGMFGKMQHMIDGYYLAREDYAGRNIAGIGAVADGIGYNPVMYELFYELPWQSGKFDKAEWMAKWPKAHYGNTLPVVNEAWDILASTVYEAPANQESAVQPVVCGRPGLRVERVTGEGSTETYYNTAALVEALGKLVTVSERFRGCGNFEFDIVDLARQALADRMRSALGEIEAAFDSGDREQFKKLSDTFLVMIRMQDALLASRSEFMTGEWIEQAMRLGRFSSERDFYRWNARMLLTTWSEDPTSKTEGMVDSGYREWNGMLTDYYYPRWKQLFDGIYDGNVNPAGYRDMEIEWTVGMQPYPNVPAMDPIMMAGEVYEMLMTK